MSYLPNEGTAMPGNARTPNEDQGSDYMTMSALGFIRGDRIRVAQAGFAETDALFVASVSQKPDGVPISIGLSETWPPQIPDGVRYYPWTSIASYTVVIVTGADVAHAPDAPETVEITAQTAGDAAPASVPNPQPQRPAESH